MGFGIPLRSSVGFGVGGIASLRSNPADSSAPPGPVAALDLDFTTGALDPRITFTRASQASYFDSAGQMQIAAVNQPRFDYDPVTLQPKGLFLEPTGTNLVTNSATASNQTVTGLTVGAVYIFSFYGVDEVTLSGAVNTIVTGIDAFPTRTVFNFTAATTTLTISYFLGQAQFIQLETGSVQSSWINTLSAPATRAADSAVMTGTNFSSWYPNVIAQDGTIYAEYSTTSGITTYAAALLLDTNNSIYLYQSSATASGRMNYNNLSIVIGTPIVTVPTYVVGSVIRSAASYSFTSNTLNIAFGGVVSNAFTIFRPPTVALTQMYIGMPRSSTTTTVATRIRKIRWYSVKLSNSQMSGLTA